MAPSLYERYMNDTLARMPATDADADFLITSNALYTPSRAWITMAETSYW